MEVDIIIPIIGMLTGIIIPVSVFIWQYKDAKGKKKPRLKSLKIWMTLQK